MAQTYAGLEQQSLSAATVQGLIAAMHDGDQGVFEGYENELAVSERGAGTNRSVDAAIGAAVVGDGSVGVFFHSSAVENLTLNTNDSGSTRVDTIVVKLDLTQSAGSQTCALEVHQGTPGAGAPTLTQTATEYELPLADVSCADGYSAITDSEITDRRSWIKGSQAKPTYIRASSGDQSISSSTTLANHADFTFTGKANARYRVRFHLLIEGHTSGDFKYFINGPSGYAYDGHHIASGTEYDTCSDDAAEDVQVAAISTPQVVVIDVLLSISSTGGTVTFQWAQNSSSGTASIVYEESWMSYEELS